MNDGKLPVRRGLQDLQRQFLSLRGFIPIAIQRNTLAYWDYVKDWSGSVAAPNLDFSHER